MAQKTVTALLDELDAQRYFVVELLRSDLRLGRFISETLKKEVKEAR